MNETRTRRRLCRAIEHLGFTIKSVEWEPIGANIEMQGPSGGWLVTTECGEYMTGLNVGQVIDLAELVARRKAARRAAFFD